MKNEFLNITFVMSFRDRPLRSFLSKNKVIFICIENNKVTSAEFVEGKNLLVKADIKMGGGG